MHEQTAEKRVMRTYSIKESTDRKINQLTKMTYRGKQDVIDLAVSELHARTLGQKDQTHTEPSKAA